MIAIEPMSVRNMLEIKGKLYITTEDGDTRVAPKNVILKSGVIVRTLYYVLMHMHDTFLVLPSAE